MQVEEIGKNVMNLFCTRREQSSHGLQALRGPSWWLVMPFLILHHILWTPWSWIGRRKQSNSTMILESKFTQYRWDAHVRDRIVKSSSFFLNLYRLWTTVLAPHFTELSLIWHVATIFTWTSSLPLHSSSLPSASESSLLTSFRWMM